MSWIEGEDFTIDSPSGNLVLTAKFLLKRGTCCQSGCRHCPYGFNESSLDPDIPQELQLHSDEDTQEEWSGDLSP
jgi:hypothetical protein